MPKKTPQDITGRDQHGSPHKPLLKGEFCKALKLEVNLSKALDPKPVNPKP